MADKASIQKRFSADPDRYYKVKARLRGARVYANSMC